MCVINLSVFEQPRLISVGSSPQKVLYALHWLLEIAYLLKTPIKGQISLV